MPVNKENICKVSTFSVPYKQGWNKYLVRVEQVYLDERKERFRLGHPFNGLEAETNRPFFRLRNLKHRKPDIKVLSQRVPQGNNLEELFVTMVEHLDSMIKYE